MTYKSTPQRVTSFFDPRAKAGIKKVKNVAKKVVKTSAEVVKLAAKGIKAVVSDPLGIKRDKVRSKAFDKYNAEIEKQKKEERKKDYIKVD